MIKKIKLFSFLTFFALLTYNCSSDDDSGNSEETNNEEDVNSFVGNYIVDNKDCSFNGQVGSISGTELIISQPISDNVNQIAIKNLRDNNNVYDATTNGNTFTINSNSDNLTGSGTLKSDGQTIEYSYSVPNSVDEECNGIATKN